MIGYLSGHARGKDVVVDSSGVGWKVSTARPLEDGAAVSLEVCTVMRDSSLSLFAFATVEEKECFEALVKVSGVGPSTALSILAHLSAQELADAVERRDVTTIAKARGVGVKVAERIVSMVALPSGISVSRDELVDALESLGFDRHVSATAVAEARRENEGDADALAAALRIVRGAP